MPLPAPWREAARTQGPPDHEAGGWGSGPATVPRLRPLGKSLGLPCLLSAHWRDWDLDPKLPLPGLRHSRAGCPEERGRHGKKRQSTQESRLLGTRSSDTGQMKGTG